MRSIVLMLAAAFVLPAQPQLPEGAGRDEVVRLCRTCHELARSFSVRQNREGWQTTLTKMTGLGMRATDQEHGLMLDYLTKNFPAEDLPPINVNKATAIELESRLGLKRSQASALIAYRSKVGGFKTIEDLKKVPNIDSAKIDAKKDQIVF